MQEDILIFLLSVTRYLLTIAALFSADDLLQVFRRTINKN